MSSCFTSILLAGVFFIASAHGKIIPLKDNVTSLMLQGKLPAEEEAASSKYILDKTKDERRPSSAVQDWSLVCQQLCGAALGGAACIPHCGNVSSEISLHDFQIANAKTLMASEAHLICPKLCGLQLGDAVCTCSKWIAKDATSENGNATKQEQTNVCAIFCDTINVTLTGCSPCLKKNFPNNEIDKFEEISKKVKEAKEEVHNTTTVATPKTETPDWNQLCAALCKTGDGGSLCNCDLSPFMV